MRMSAYISAHPNYSQRGGEADIVKITNYYCSPLGIVVLGRSDDEHNLQLQTAGKRSENRSGIASVPVKPTDSKRG